MNTEVLDSPAWRMRPSGVVLVKRTVWRNFRITVANDRLERSLSTQNKFDFQPHNAEKEFIYMPNQVSSPMGDSDGYLYDTVMFFLRSFSPGQL